MNNLDGFGTHVKKLFELVALLFNLRWKLYTFFCTMIE